MAKRTSQVVRIAAGFAAGWLLVRSSVLSRFLLDSRVPPEHIGPGQIAIGRMVTTPDGYFSAMGIAVLLFLVLVFHALRRQTGWVKTLCSLGAVVFGALSYSMVALFVVMLFSI